MTRCRLVLLSVVVGASCLGCGAPPTDAAAPPHPGALAVAESATATVPPEPSLPDCAGGEVVGASAQIADEGVGAPAEEAAREILRLLGPSIADLPLDALRPEDGAETLWTVRSDDGQRVLAEVELFAMTAGGYVGQSATACVLGSPELHDPQVVGDGPTIPEEEAYTFAAIATDEASLAAEWARFGLAGAVPRVDLERQVALFAGFGESGSCPFVYGGVEIDIAGGRAGLMAADAPPRDCTSDYNPRTLVVAVDRELLPAGPFHLRVDRDWHTLSVRSAAVPPEPPADDDDATGFGLVVAPAPVDGLLTAEVENRRPTDPVVAHRRVRLDRWTGHHWQPATPPDVSSPTPEPLTVGPGERGTLLTIDLAPLALAPGWYRLTGGGDFADWPRATVELLPTG